MAAAGFLLSVFFGFVPMLAYAWFMYWLDRYEKEPIVLLGVVFTWGAVIAAGGAFCVNTVLGMGVFLVTSSEGVTELATGSLIAPLVEEGLKGIAVLLVFLFFRREFDSVLDGIVYAAIVALGFAATENTFYIFTYGYNEEGFSGLAFMVFVRVILVGWQHPFYTAFTGIGLALARSSPRFLVKVLAPAAGLGIAIFAHSLHNTLASVLQGPEGIAVGTSIDWFGWALMGLVILAAIQREGRWMRELLHEEVELGALTPGQYAIACSAWQQSLTRTRALFAGRYGQTRRFYQVCAELAHKKRQWKTLGDENGNTAIIEQLRSELSRLSPLV